MNFFVTCLLWVWLKVASKGKNKKRKKIYPTREPTPKKVGTKSDGTKYRLPSSEQTRYLVTGMTMLRSAIGEEKTIALARSNADERRRLFRELIADKRPEVRDALARVLTGLGLDPDELVKEATE